MLWIADRRDLQDLSRTTSAERTAAEDDWARVTFAMKIRSGHGGMREEPDFL